jgi:uncharacterized membrane protein
VRLRNSFSAFFGLVVIVFVILFHTQIGVVLSILHGMLGFVILIAALTLPQEGKK